MGECQMDRAAIEAALRQTYAARERNDPVGTGEIFAVDATFTNAGDPQHCAAAATYVGHDLHRALRELCEKFQASSYHVRSMIIEGDRAAVICRADFLYVPSGRHATLDLVHFWTFRDGKATELVEYFDTAHVARIISEA
jgi:ketosteroid isomerase-like protein